MKTRLFFDIETRANPAALARLPEPEAPANYKDAAKIAAAIAEKKAQQAALAALDPDTGYVSSIAWQTGLNAEPQVRILVPITADMAGPVPDTVTLYVYSNDAERDRMERLLLEHFWAAFARANGVCAGYKSWPSICPSCCAARWRCRPRRRPSCPSWPSTGPTLCATCSRCSTNGGRARA